MYSTIGEAILCEDDATSFNISHMFIFEGEDFREEPVRRETDTEFFEPVSSHMLCVEVPDMLKNIKVMNQIN